MAKIGFIGLGHMGLPMAINLVRAGHDVLGYDKQATASQAFQEAGGGIAEQLQDFADDRDYIFTMLQTGDQVLSVCSEGSDALFPYLKPGVLWIDCSTIGMRAVEILYEKAHNYGVLCIDAPVSGGVSSAQAGGLTFMVGGEEALFYQAQPLLDAMGKKIIYAGLAGAGQAAKLCNNLILGASMVAVSEAFLLAERLGLSAQKLHEVVSQSSGQCWSMTTYPPVAGIVEQCPADHGYRAGFATAMMLKDLKLAEDASNLVGLQLPLTQETTQLYNQANKTLSTLDFTAIIQLLGEAGQVKNGD